MKILKYIILCASLLNAYNENQTNNVVRVPENYELQNTNEKDIIEVIDKIRPTHISSKTQAQANAGGDIIVDVNKTFTLDASESTGNIVRYKWKHKGNILSDAPITKVIIKKIGSFEIVLEITENNGEVLKDTVVVDVVSNKKCDVIKKCSH